MTHSESLYELGEQSQNNIQSAQIGLVGGMASGWAFAEHEATVERQEAMLYETRFNNLLLQGYSPDAAHEILNPPEAERTLFGKIWEGLCIAFGLCVGAVGLWVAATFVWAVIQSF